VFRLRLIPKEEKFFNDFTALADRIVSGATLLERMLASDPPAWDTALQIKQIEQECDSLTHNIIQRLNRTFVTPIDREDIHALATSLDDVMDAIDAAANVVRRFRIASLRYGARELASLTWQSAMQVRVAVEALEKRQGVHERAVEVNRLENAADDVHDEALRRLFDEEKNAITVIKWKEMFDLLEEATDRCEDVANVLEGVVVKHG
jgi:predicted phosphate transport protein (TIGR00153 family)